MLPTPKILNGCWSYDENKNAYISELSSVQGKDPWNVTIPMDNVWREWDNNHEDIIAYIVHIQAFGRRIQLILLND